MPVFSAYFDDSGKKSDAQILAVGGAVSTVQKWSALEAQWISILSSWGVTAFHARKLWTNRGEFVGWRDRRADKEMLIEQLATCIKKNTHKTIAAAVVMSAWRSVDRIRRLREELGGPFPFCAISCLAHLQRWAERSSVEFKDIQLIFEDGSEDKGLFITQCKKEFRVIPAFGDKSLVPLQAADLIAWEGRRHLQDLYRKDTDVRASTEVLRSVADKAVFFDRKHLMQLCDEDNIRRRQS